MITQGLTIEHDIMFTAMAQEEIGLKGMRALYEDYKDRAIAFVDVLGEGNGIGYAALGIHWWRKRVWISHTLRRGLPNVNQAIRRAVGSVLQIHDPQLYEDCRIQLNIATLNSGAVFNREAETGWFSLGMRSLDPEHIESMENQTQDILESVSDEPGMQFEIESVSQTPPGDSGRT